MRFQRKGWDRLKDDYRKRLLRGGIDRAAYEAGASLGKARGHTPKRIPPTPPIPPLTTAEVDAYIEKMRDLYRVPEYAIREDMAALTSEQLRDLVRNQEKMEDAYHYGNADDATRLWELRDQTLPEWMNMYHSWFN